MKSGLAFERAGQEDNGGDYQAPSGIQPNYSCRSDVAEYVPEVRYKHVEGGHRVSHQAFHYVRQAEGATLVVRQVPVHRAQLKPFKAHRAQPGRQDQPTKAQRNEG